MPLSIALASAFVIGAVAFAGSPARFDVNEKYRVRIAAWGKDAALKREKKDVKKVAKGQVLMVGDRVLTGKKDPVDLACADWGLQRLKPNSILKYLSMKPSVLKYGSDFELEQELEKGSVLTRLGYLTKQTVFQVRGRGKITAPRGTSFSVDVKGDELTLIVAEGEVEVNLDAKPDETIEVLAREKLVVDATLPANPVPTTPADEARLRELLSLPVLGIGGYEAGKNLTAKDVFDIITLRIDPAPIIDGAVGSNYRVAWRPLSVAVTARDHFWSVDATGKRRDIGKGYYIEALSNDGKTIVASKPKQGLWTMNFDGSGVRQISKRPLGSVSLSPDGKRLVAGEGWTMKPPRSVATKYWTMAITGKGEKLLAPTSLADFSRTIWRRGGKQLVFAYRLPVKSDRMIAPMRVVDGDATPAKTLYEGLGSVYQMELSPLGKWLLLQTKDVFPVVTDQVVRVADATAFPIPGFSNVAALPGETSFLGQRNNLPPVVFDPANPATGVPADEGVEQYPQNQFGNLPPWDLSPNGELLAWARTPSGTLHIADVARPERDQDTYAGAPYIWDVSWVAPDRVRMQNLIVTLGLKRRPSWAKPRVQRSAGRDGANGFVKLEQGDRPIEVKGINDRGHMAGIVKGGGYQPFFWSSRDGLQILSDPSGSAYFAFGISPDDVVVGTGERNGVNEAFSWTPQLGFAWTGITGKNVHYGGIASNGNALWHADDRWVLWRNEGTVDRSDPAHPKRGTITEMAFPRGFRPSEGRAMSPRGHFVGFLQRREGLRIATWNGVDPPEVRPELDPMEEGQLDSLIMNGRGQIAGIYTRRRGGAATFVLTPGEPFKRVSDQMIVPIDLNARGQLVGIKFVNPTQAPSEQERAGNYPVFWDGTKLIDLPTLAPLGWRITSAGGINDRGQIGGRARTGERGFGFMLTPKPVVKK